MGEMADDFSPGGRCAPEENEDLGINDPDDIEAMTSPPDRAMWRESAYLEHDKEANP